MSIPILHVRGWSRGVSILTVVVRAADWQQISTSPPATMRIASADRHSTAMLNDVKAFGAEVAIDLVADCRQHRWVGEARDLTLALEPRR